MALIDILIVLLVVGLVVARMLKFKLPKDTRDAAARKAEFERLFGQKVPPAAGRPPVQEPETQAFADGLEADAAEAAQPASPRRGAPKVQDVAHLPGLEQIKVMDAGFDLAGFTEGAVAAYTYFYTCYNDRDREGIINLCGPALEEQVLQDWETDPAAITVEGEPAPVFKEARLHGRTSLVTLAFTATHRVGKGAPKPTRSLWVFARALNSTDPNWEVQSITPTADA